jgi:hypothetical protein
MNNVDWNNERISKNRIIIKKLVTIAGLQFFIDPVPYDLL